MTGYVFCTGRCLGCGRVFSFNPHRVPSSTAVTGTREPICRNCFDMINANRVGRGLEPFELRDDAYDPLPENEL